MERAHKLYGCLALVLALLLSSCAATKLTTTWKDEGYTGGPLKKVLVVGLTEKFQTRRMFEDIVTEEFKKNGVVAVPSADVIMLDSELNKENIKSAAVNLGADAVFVTHLVGADESTVYRPAKDRHYYMNFSDGYPAMYQNVYEPGYYAKYEYVALQSDIYHAETEKLIWSVSSDILVKETVVGELVADLIKRITKDLRKNMLIQ